MKEACSGIRHDAHEKRLVIGWAKDLDILSEEE
jgi:hypothetical protein